MRALQAAHDIERGTKVTAEAKIAMYADLRGDSGCSLKILLFTAGGELIPAFAGNVDGVRA